MLWFESLDELRAAGNLQTLYADSDERSRHIAELEDADELRNAELTLKHRDGSLLVLLENSRVVRTAKEGFSITNEP